MECGLRDADCGPFRLPPANPQSEIRNPNWHKRFLTPFSLVILACAWAAPAGAGEPGPEKPPAVAPDDIDVYLDTDEDADRLLRLAGRAESEGKWKPCLEAYLECARRYGNKVARRGSEDPELYVSMAEAVHRLMAATPRGGRELWALLKRAEFASALARAGSDPERLVEAERAFSGLPFAAEALLRAAEARYARGDVAGAVSAWLRLARGYPEGEYPRVKVLARAGLAAAVAGLDTEARQVLAALRVESALASVTAGGVELRVVEEVERRLAAAGKPGQPAAEAQDCWTALGGDASRSRLAGAPIRPTVRRWQKALPVPASWTMPVNPHFFGFQQPEPDSKKPPPWPFPAYHPAAAGEVLYLSGDSGAMALRTHDGEPIWTAPQQGGGVAVSGGLAGPALAGGRLLARQGLIPTMNPQFQQMGRMLGPGAPMLVLDRNTGKELLANGLRPPTALGAAKEIRKGKEKDPEKDKEKEKDANAPEEEPGLQEPALFVSLPASDGAGLYCGLMRSATQPEYELAAFDLPGGNLCWRTFVCGAAPVRTPGNPWGGGGGALLSEIGQPPAMVGETIWVVTNLGALAALEAGTGRLIWLRLYPRYAPDMPKGPDPFRPGNPGYTAPNRTGVDMWDPGAPCVVGGVLYAAPQDCDYLLAVEAASGRLLWRAPRAGLRRLIGVSGGKVFLSGKDELVARDAAGGKALWRLRLGAEVVGLGALGRDFVAVSTAAALEVLDLSGRPLFSYKWAEARSEAGNVLVHGESIYTISATHANAYCDMERVTRRLAEQIQEHPEEALPRFQIAALQYNAGKFEEAIAVLAEAAARARPGERYAGAELAAAIRGKLWQCHLRLAGSPEEQNAPEQSLAHLAAALGCCPDQEALARTLSLKAGFLEVLKRPAEAVAALQEILEKCPDASCDRPDGSRLRAWLLVQDRIAALMAKSGREPYAVHEQRAAALLADARQAASPEQAEKVARLYPNSQAARSGLLLAAELAGKGGLAEAELRCLRSAVFLQGETAQGNGLRAELALAYARHGYLGAARTVARELAERGGRVVVAGAETSCEQFAAAHPELLRAPPPELAPPLAEKWRVRLPAARLAAGSAGDAQLVFVGEGEVRAVDASNGKTLWKSELNKLGIAPEALTNYGPNYLTAQVDGDAVVLRAGALWAVLDRSSGRLRWKDQAGSALDQQYYYNNAQQFRGEGTQQNYSAADGVLAAQESSSKMDQLGRGEISEQVKALSVDDGKVLWTLAMGKGSPGRQQYIHGYGYMTNLNTLARSLAGGLVSWRASVEQNPSRGGQSVKTALLLIDAASGRVAKRSEIGNGMPLGLVCDRLLCNVQNQQNWTTRLVAFGLDGQKAWESAGNWQLRASAFEDGRLVVLTDQPGMRVNNEPTSRLAGVDARSGKLLWKAADADKMVNPGDVLILQDRVIVSGQTQPDNWGYYAGGARRAFLEALEATEGKKLWNVPFLPVDFVGVKAAGRSHLAHAFLKYQHLDADGKTLDLQRFNRWRGGWQQPAQPAAVRYQTTVWLFDLAGGKAVWEWGDPEAATIETNKPGGQGLRRFYGGAGAHAVRGGLVVITPEAAVLLGSAAGRQPGR